MALRENPEESTSGNQVTEEERGGRENDELGDLGIENSDSCSISLPPSRGQVSPLLKLT